MRTVVGPTRRSPQGWGPRQSWVMVTLEPHEIEALEWAQAMAWDAYEGYILSRSSDPDAAQEYEELIARARAELSILCSMVLDVESGEHVLEFVTSNESGNTLDREMMFRNVLVLRMAHDVTPQIVESYQTLRRLSLRPGKYPVQPFER